MNSPFQAFVVYLRGVLSPRTCNQDMDEMACIGMEGHRRQSVHQCTNRAAMMVFPSCEHIHFIGTRTRVVLHIPHSLYVNH